MNIFCFSINYPITIQICATVLEFGRGGLSLAFRLGEKIYKCSIFILLLVCIAVFVTLGEGLSTARGEGKLDLKGRIFIFETLNFNKSKI
jgi:hypothetical protein